MGKAVLIQQAFIKHWLSQTTQRECVIFKKKRSLGGIHIPVKLTTHIFPLDTFGFLFFNKNIVMSKEPSTRRNEFVPSPFLKKEVSL